MLLKVEVLNYMKVKSWIMLVFLIWLCDVNGEVIDYVMIYGNC